MARPTIVAASAAVLVTIISSPACADDLSLVCNGNASNINKLTWLPAQIEVTFTGNTGRMKLPSFMRSSVHNPQDDWSGLSHVEIGDAEIKGRIVVGLFVNPSFSIDRHTGSMELSGNGIGFTGTCRPFDAKQSERLF